MRAGVLNRTISIERKVVEQDATYGTPVVTWERVALCKAEVQDALPSRSEAVRAGLEQARNQTRIRIRWRSDIDSTMRVVLYGTSEVVYQIVGGPAEIDGRNGLEMVCERYTTTSEAT